jgi:uncharacterized membrane protein
MASLPILEHGAIPTGIALGLPVWQTFLLTQIGYAATVTIVYALGDAGIAWAHRREGRIRRLVDAVLHHLHGKVNRRMGTLGLLGLTAFVSLPIPGAGIWTGSGGAFLLGIPFRTAFPYILAGNLINATIMTLATTGTVAAFRFFL